MQNIDSTIMIAAAMIMVGIAVSISISINEVARKLDHIQTSSIDRHLEEISYQLSLLNTYVTYLLDDAEEED